MFYLVEIGYIAHITIANPLQNPPSYTNKVAIAVAFCYVWGCTMPYIDYIQTNQYKIIL